MVLPEFRVVGRKNRQAEAHRANDEAVVVLRLTRSEAGVEFVAGRTQAAIDGIHHLAVAHLLRHQELRREADFDVAHALGGVVEHQFVGNAEQRRVALHDGGGQREAAQVFLQAGVLILEHRLAQALHGFRRQGDSSVVRQFDQGFDAQTAVEMQVQVGFREGAEEFVGKTGHGRAPGGMFGASGRGYGQAGSEWMVCLGAWPAPTFQTQHAKPRMLRGSASNRQRSTVDRGGECAFVERALTAF